MNVLNLWRTFVLVYLQGMLMSDFLEQLRREQESVSDHDCASEEQVMSYVIWICSRAR